MQSKAEASALSAPRATPASRRRWAPLVSLLVLAGGCEVVDPLASPLAYLSSTETCNLVIWLKAFIDPSTTTPSYVTTVLGPSTYKGRGALWADWGADAQGADVFLHDNRGPSGVINASSRMHSEVRFTVGPTGAPVPYASDQITGTTVGMDRNIAKTNDYDKCGPLQASTNGMSWSQHNVSGMTYSLYLRGSASDPCLTILPSIDYAGRLLVTNEGSYVTVRFVGSVDFYPSYEMYVRDNDSGAQTKQVFYVANKGNNPNNLWSDPYNFHYGVGVDKSVRVCHRQGRG